MDMNLIKDFLTYLTIAMALVNLFNAFVGKRRDSYETNLKESDKAFAEFVQTYAGHHSEISTRITQLERTVDALEDEQYRMAQELIQVKTRVEIHTKGGGE